MGAPRLNGGDRDGKGVGKKDVEEGNKSMLGDPTSLKKEYGEDKGGDGGAKSKL